MADELVRRVPSDLMLRNIVEVIDGSTMQDDSAVLVLPRAFYAVAILASQQALDDAVVRLEARGRPRLAAIFVAQLDASPTYETLFTLARMKYTETIRKWSKTGSKDIRDAAAILL